MVAFIEGPHGPLPWERQPDESSKAFAAFVVYRDLGPSKRSLDAVGRRLADAPVKRKRGAHGTILDWSARYLWVNRASAWDAEQDRIGRQAQLDAIREMHRRHAEAAVSLLTKALDRLKAMKPEELSPAHLLNFVVESAKLERLARGEPESIQEQRSEVTVNGEVDFFQRVRQRADTIRSSLPASALPNQRNGESVDQAQADSEAS